MNTVTITLQTGEIIKEPYGATARCDSCGKTADKAKGVITGGQLCDDEWACCALCYDEMVDRGCCFEELGNGVYRKQKY